jgi:hypothetical protein
MMKLIYRKTAKERLTYLRKNAFLENKIIERALLSEEEAKELYYELVPRSNIIGSDPEEWRKIIGSKVFGITISLNKDKNGAA